mgnify:CR=1 FL=1
MLPDIILSPAELREFGSSKRRLACSEEFVQLRRGDDRSGQHGVHLPAMMDLVLKEMHQQPVAALDLYARVAVDPDGAAERYGIKGFRRQARRGMSVPLGTKALCGAVACRACQSAEYSCQGVMLPKSH